MEEKSTNDSHKNILKSTGVFGLVQLFKMLIGVVGTKFVAVFLGPIGMGTVGLLNNMIAIISSLTSFGTNVTLTREVSLANADENKDKLPERLNFLQKWSFLVGLVGAVITLVLSPILSKLTFGSTKYYYWFIIISINFVFLSLTTYRIAILQGLLKIKQLALSSLVSSLFITIVTIPIYYYYRFDGILPVVLLSGIIGFLVNWYYTRNIKITKVKHSLLESYKQGKSLLELGFLLSINVIFGQICAYLIKLYLNHNGANTSVLGFYEVSNIILVSYVGMIFTAMGTDFYPRLTAIHNDNNKVNQFVNDQIEVGLLLVSPLIILFYFLSPILISILYTKDFLSVLLILKAALFAIIIKAIIWPLAFIILAKGEKKLYFKQELLGDFLNIFSTILFYHYFGLEGIGLAMVLNYSIYGIYVYRILNKRFEFKIRKDTLRIILISFILGLAALGIVFFVDYPDAYLPLGIVLLFSVLISLYELNKRVFIAAYYLKLKQKITNQNKNG
jgi:O-antigen/teichoic acid export membrane protein